MSITANNISKRFGDFTALDDVSLDVQSGELVALLGPSGSGKTTLLRVIAGLQQPDAGTVLFHGEDTTRTSVKNRRVGFVFQHYALFKHMTVFDNVAFGLRVLPRRARPSRGEIRDRVMALLKLVQVDWLANQYPSQLSGGQRQRVALARALVIEPKVLLLDEPFGALDAKVRRELRKWLRRLHDELHVTSVFVTHDQEEALEVADRVVIMNHGRIVQCGTPEEVYDAPASPFVYEFLGSVNLFQSRVQSGCADIHGARVEVIAATPSPVHARAYIRPQDFEVSLDPINGNAFETVVRHVSLLGSLVRLEVSRPGDDEEIEVELTREQYRQMGVSRGAHVYLRPLRAAVFPGGVITAR